MSESDPTRHASRTARGAAELDLGEAATEPAPLAAAGGRRAHRRRHHRRGARLRGRAHRADGRQHPGRGPAGPRRLPRAWPAATASSDPGTPLAPALEGAYALGRGEARSGRTHGRAARRLPGRRPGVVARAVGDRGRGRPGRGDRWPSSPSWSSPTSTSCRRPAWPGTPTSWPPPAGSGSATSSGWASSLLSRRRRPTCSRPAAERADWDPPRTLTAVLLPERPRAGRARRARPAHAPPGGGPARPRRRRGRVGRGGAAGPRRGRAGPRGAAAGPARPPGGASGRPGPGRTRGRRTCGRSGRAGSRLSTGARRSRSTPRSTWPRWCWAPTPTALADLRRQVLAPLADLRPATADRLAETLRAWLLHQGRRDDVAAALHVHPQTVRYRMGQVRELYGDRLPDPGTVAALTVALATDRSEPSGRSASERTPASG